jgi:hypothetical protein
MDWLNPVEWLAWLYGKLFQGHGIIGGIAVVGMFSVIGLVLWIRGIDKYKEEHPEAVIPKQQAVTVNSSLVTAQVSSAPASPQQPTSKAIPQVKHTKKPQVAPKPKDGGVWPVGQTGVIVEPGGDLDMRNSQVNNYSTGVDVGGHAHVEGSQIDAAGRTPIPSAPPLAVPADCPPGAPVMRNFTLKGKQYDLRRIPVPAGSASTESTEEQRKIIDDLAKQWKDAHPDRAAKKSALEWINQQLEAQHRDFRVNVPTVCPPDPDFVGVYVPTCGVIDGVTIQGAGEAGVAVANGGTGVVTNSEITANDCD